MMNPYLKSWIEKNCALVRSLAIIGSTVSLTEDNVMTGPLDCSGIVQCNGDHNGGHWPSMEQMPAGDCGRLYLWRPSDMSFWRPPDIRH